MNTLSSIFQASHKGALIIGFDSATIPDLKGGKKNPMQGRITKVMTGATAMLNRDYEKSRNNQLVAAGFKATFEVKPRRWGIYPMAGLPVITNIDKKGDFNIYLNTSVLRAGKVHYLLDGQPIDKNKIEGLKDSVGTGIATDEVEKQLAEMTPAEIEAIAVFKGLLNEAVNNPDSMELSAELLADIQDNTKDLYPRDFKAVSITAIRVNKQEYKDISITEA